MCCVCISAARSKDNVWELVLVLSFHLVEAGLLLFLSLFTSHTTWPVIFYVILLSLPRISHSSAGITDLSYCIQRSVGLRDWNEVGKLVQLVFFFFLLRYLIRVKITFFSFLKGYVSRQIQYSLGKTWTMVLILTLCESFPVDSFAFLIFEAQRLNRIIFLAF